MVQVKPVKWNGIDKSFFHSFPLFACFLHHRLMQHWCIFVYGNPSILNCGISRYYICLLFFFRRSKKPLHFRWLSKSENNLFAENASIHSESMNSANVNEIWEKTGERGGGGVRQSSNGENSPTFTRNKLTRHYIALEYLLSVSYSHIWLLVVLMLLLLLGGWVALHEKRVYIASIENKPV